MTEHVNKKNNNKIFTDRMEPIKKVKWKADIELNEKGIKQAEETRNSLKKWRNRFNFMFAIKESGTNCRDYKSRTESKFFTILNPHQDMPPNTLLLLWVCVLKSHSRTLYNFTIKF